MAQRFPLSKTEYGIFAEQMSAGGTAYNCSFTIKLGHEVDLERLCEAIRAAVDAHPNLRSGFALGDDGVAYRYLRDCATDIEMIEAEDFDFSTLVRPFDLFNDILYLIPPHFTRVQIKIVVGRVVPVFSGVPAAELFLSFVVSSHKTGDILA